MNEKGNRVPAPSGDDALRAGVGEIAGVLRDLHRALVQLVRNDYEREHGPVGGAGNLFRLLVHDPAFDWLHTLSELMVDIDELLDGDILTATDAAAVRAEVETLVIAPVGSTSEFSRRYLEALQADPSVVMTHARVRRTAAALPLPGPSELAEVRQARHQWAARRTKRGRTES